MVRARYGARELAYTRSAGWEALNDDASEFVVARLNDAVQRVERGYLSEYTNAMAMLTEALGPNGWEITSYDVEPIDRGVVY